MNFFGSDDNDEDNSRSAPIMTPYMNINPHFLDTADEYILPEDAGPIRSRAQMMFSTIGTATVLGAGIGGSESLRYSGLQWIKGKSQRMQFTSAVLKNGGRVAQKFGSAAFLYCMCSIICEKSRGVEDELNTMVGGAAAGGLFMIPSALGSAEDSAVVQSRIKSAIRKLPPAGRLFFGATIGLSLSGLLCLYRMKAPDYIGEFTRRT